MPITARQRRVLDYIKRYFEVRSEAPTIAEIGKEFGMSSSASVHHVVSTLERNTKFLCSASLPQGLRSKRS